MYTNSVNDDVQNMMNVESGPLCHSQEIKLTKKKLKINDTKYHKAQALSCWIIMFTETNSFYVIVIACSLQK